jgi:hypothetical protein
MAGVIEMKLKLLAPHVIADRWYPRGAVLDPPPPGYQPTPLMEGLDDEAESAVAYAKLKVWGRFPWPYGLYPPSGIPLDNPPIPRPLDDNQPVFHYVGAPEYL